MPFPSLPGGLIMKLTRGDEDMHQHFLPRFPCPSSNKIFAGFLYRALNSGSVADGQVPTRIATILLSAFRACEIVQPFERERD